jgi:hypothetical protein
MMSSMSRFDLPPEKIAEMHRVMYANVKLIRRAGDRRQPCGWSPGRRGCRAGRYADAGTPHRRGRRRAD